MSPVNCIFCSIIKKEIPSSLVFEDSEFVAFNDIHPKAPVHVLIVSKTHIASVKDLKAGEEELTGRMIGLAKNIAREQKLDGYKLIFNVGPKGGQLIDHLHLHLLGGWGEAPKKVEV
ncbi:HIT domain-containing protein [Candidatus Giovannonibacteria bacterium]|nr:HIT domain-containing protein [Candidatus Giovannonibacteria bacterium]